MVIGTQFPINVNPIAAAIKAEFGTEFSVLTIGGWQSLETISKNKDAFNEAIYYAKGLSTTLTKIEPDDHYDILVAPISRMGVGLNFQRANYLVVWEPFHSVTEWVQLKLRIHRIG